MRSKPMKRNLALSLLFLLLSFCSARPDVHIDPKFGHPYVFANRILFTSADGTHLIAIDKKGQLQWELTFPDYIFVQRLGDQLAVQSERHVYKVDVSTGTKIDLYTMPKHEVLTANFDENFLAASDTRFGNNRIRILDPVRFTTAWESSSIERFIGITTSTIVAVTADRRFSFETAGGRKSQSYELKNPALRGFDRKTGKEHWSIPLEDAYLSTSEQIGKAIAIVERLHVYEGGQGGSQRLLIVDADTGTVQTRKQGEFTDLWPIDETLGVLELSPLGAKRAEFYVCKLPACSKESPIALEAKEILRVRVYRNYIITAGIYDSACFDRATGKRLWEKGQLEWSEPFDDTMVITDYHPQDHAARIVAIDLATGQEHVLFSRTVTKHDRARFRPW